MNQQSKIISHHAPKGHKAILPTSGLCTDCAFTYESMCPNVRGAAKRKNGQNVVFVKI